jgi:peptidoglycan/LPS O-acetylase OafA/YrhL
VALIVLTVGVGLHGVFSHNWWAYFGLLWKLPIYTPTADCVLDASRCGIAPTWSLAIEVWFYATLPLFAWGAAQLTRRAGGFGWFRAELCLLALVAIVSIPIVGNLTTDLDKWLWYSPLGHGLWFALGMALAATSVRANQTGNLARPISWIASRPGVCWLGAAAVYLLASLVVLDPVGGWKPDYTVEYILFGVVAALLLLPAVFDDGGLGIPRRILANPVLAWLGLISYGIFLYNWPVVVALDRGGVTDWWPGAPFLVLTSMTAVITVACATASYYLVERPILRFKYRRRGGGEADEPSEKVAIKA